MSKFTRRDFIHAGCTIAGATLVPHFIDQAEAGLRLHGSSPPAAPSGLSKRNVLNLNAANGTTDYAFIDHTKAGSNGLWSPFSSAFTGANPTFSSTLDANGWPSISSASGQAFGGGITVPDPANFPGPYIIDWTGNGKIQLNIQLPSGSVATWTVGNGSNGMPAPVNCSVTFNSGGTLQVTSTGGASTASFQFTFTNTVAGPETLALEVLTTGTSGFFVKNLRFYRAADATDLANGLIFRRPWKQSIVSLCPSYVRTMDWIGGVSSFNNRWENRTLPGNAGYTFGENWVASPNYQTDASGNNQIVVAAATPTAGNPQTTATNMVHGELATFRIPSTGGGLRSSFLPVTSITNATNGVVTTSSAHGYNTGDIIGHNFAPIANTTGNVTSGSNQLTNLTSVANLIPGMFIYGAAIPANTTIVSISTSPNVITMSNNATATPTSFIGVAFRSMQNLHQFPCTITVTGSTTYQLNVDTTGMGPFSNAGATVLSYQFQTLQVGSGGDRTPYPCMASNAGNPFSLFGNFFSPNTYRTGWFDKTISGQTDGFGNPILGVWMFGTNPSAHPGDVPVEICVALINELNAMSPAHTIGMWMNIPNWGLSSMDPDYTTASDWAINCLDTVLNPSSTVRVSGYSALGYSGATKLYNAPLVVEYANECWNGNAIQRGWLTARGIPRWPTIYPQSNFQDMQSLRSTCMARDVKAAMPSLLANTKFVLGIQGNGGMGNNQLNANYAIAFGGSLGIPRLTGDWYTNDTLVTGGNWGTPISNHDGVCPASYFDPPGAYYSVTIGTNSFVDDTAMYFGTDNSGTLSMTGGSSVTTISATVTANNSSISATNTLVAGQAIQFATSIGSNIVAATTYYVYNFGLNGSAFQIANTPFPNSGPKVPDGSGSSLATPSALTITAVSAGIPVVNQPLLGAGLPAGIYILGVSGSSPNYTLALSAAATVTGGTTITAPGPTITWGATISGTTMTLTSAATGGTISRAQPFSGPGVASGSQVIVLLSGSGGIGSTYQISPSQTVSSPTTMSNTGGNYVGAANPTQALSNFVASIVDANGLYPNDQTIHLYSTVLYPQIAAQIGPTKIVISYEGGADWVTAIGAIPVSAALTPQQSTFSLAALDSSQWGTAQVGFFNTVCAISNIFAPAVFVFIQGATGPNQTNQRWGYCLPDSYANVAGTPTEGQALLNNGAWAAISARNVALPN